MLDEKYTLRMIRRFPSHYDSQPSETAEEGGAVVRTLECNGIIDAWTLERSFESALCIITTPAFAKISILYSYVRSSASRILLTAFTPSPSTNFH